MTENEVQNALREAIRNDDEARFFALLEEHPDQLHAMTVFGTWLHFAARKGRFGIVKRLVAMGIDVNIRGGISDGTALKEAVSDGHVDIVAWLLDHGARMDVSEPQRNPLFGAIHEGHTAIAKLLIEKGIDTRVRYTGRSMKNWDAIDFARIWHRDDIVKLLEESQQQ